MMKPATSAIEYTDGLPVPQRIGAIVGISFALTMPYSILILSILFCQHYQMTLGRLLLSLRGSLMVIS